MRYVWNVLSSKKAGVTNKSLTKVLKMWRPEEVLNELQKTLPTLSSLPPLN